MPARTVRCLAIWLACLSLTGCLPSRVVIDLDPGDGTLHETEVLADPSGGGSAAKVALIDINGLLSQTPPPSLIATGSNAVDSLVRRLEKAERDPQVRAVVLRINSPGGTVAASETMYHEIRSFRERTGKPVIVSMGEVAASGGYYIALAADTIYAQESSITGSIGVIVQTFNFSSGMQKLGILGRAVVSGPNKDIANPFEPVNDQHYAIMQSMVDEFYFSFRDLVVERRAGLADAELELATDGRVFTGVQARALGLVDELGGVREAFGRAKSMVGAGSARLMKYHGEGRIVGSPYALTEVSANTANGPQQVNLVQINAPHGLIPSTGFYYLWAPGS